jgi:hypothetical protein
MRSGPDQRPTNRFRANPAQQHRGTPQGSQSYDTGERRRGNASQLYDRYVALAREAARSDDRVAAENFYQHAEHYFRVNKLARESNSQPIGQADQATFSPAGASFLLPADTAQGDTAGQ